MRERRPAVYILASKRNGTLYTGVTADLPARIWRHKHGKAEGFARDYGAETLVYFEFCETMEAAITREKRIKKWRRAWKLELIEENNPEWRDLSKDLA